MARLALCISSLTTSRLIFSNGEGADNRPVSCLLPKARQCGALFVRNKDLWYRAERPLRPFWRPRLRQYLAAASPPTRLALHHTCVEGPLVLFEWELGAPHMSLFFCRGCPRSNMLASFCNSLIDTVSLVSRPSRCIICFVSISVQLSRRFIRSLCLCVAFAERRICF